MGLLCFALRQAILEPICHLTAELPNSIIYSRGLGENLNLASDKNEKELSFNMLYDISSKLR